jgi:hypothetical protein
MHQKKGEKCWMSGGMLQMSVGKCQTNVRMHRCSGQKPRTSAEMLLSSPGRFGINAQRFQMSVGATRSNSPKQEFKCKAAVADFIMIVSVLGSRIVAAKDPAVVTSGPYG